MIDVQLARDLAAAGVLWQPVPGDRFTIDERQLAGDIFWISDLTIEVHHYNDQTILGFNGTTEWALDSVPLEVALWLPREDQLRELIGDRFVGLRFADGSWRVQVRRMPDGHVLEAADPDAECAYAKALLLLA
ncbi:MAG TPA: hypothetical protein VFJ22_21225 [Dermatophilaceae bacterium]|nr:hypothetical protein [Dermatophilaceae bacterium]